MNGGLSGAELASFQQRSNALAGVPARTAGPGTDLGVVAELRRVTAAVERNAAQTAAALNGTARTANRHAATMPAGKPW